MPTVGSPPPGIRQTVEGMIGRVSNARNNKTRPTFLRTLTDGYTCTNLVLFTRFSRRKTKCLDRFEKSHWNSVSQLRLHFPNNFTLQTCPTVMAVSDYDLKSITRRELKPTFWSDSTVCLDSVNNRHFQTIGGHKTASSITAPRNYLQIKKASQLPRAMIHVLVGKSSNQTTKK